MEAAVMLQNCVPFFDSMIRTVDFHRIRRKRPHPGLEKFRKELLAVKLAIVYLDRNPIFQHITFTRSFPVPPIIKVPRKRDNDPEPNQKREPFTFCDPKEEGKEPDLYEYHHYYHYSRRVPLINVREFIRENLSSFISGVRPTSETDEEYAEMDRLKRIVLKESGSINNSDENSTELMTEELCRYLKHLYAKETLNSCTLLDRIDVFLRRHKGPIKVLDYNKSAKWPRVVMQKLTPNDFKYARKVSNNRVKFIHKTGQNRAIRKFKNQKNQSIAFTVQGKNSPKNMTLRSDAVKQTNMVNNSLKLSAPSLSQNSNIANDIEMDETFRLEDQYNGTLSPVNGSIEKKKRSIGRPKGSKSLFNMPDTVENSPDNPYPIYPSSQDFQFDDYHRFNKRRRLMSQNSDPCHSKSSQNILENGDRSNRSRKTATRSEENTSSGKIIETVTISESEDSSSGDAETVADEPTDDETRVALNYEKKKRQKSREADDNETTEDDDSNLPSVSRVNSEKAQGCSGNGAFPGFNFQPVENRRSQVIVKKETYANRMNNMYATPRNNAQTNQCHRPQIIVKNSRVPGCRSVSPEVIEIDISDSDSDSSDMLSRKNDESRKQGERISNVRAGKNVQPDENLRPQVIVKNVSFQENHTKINDTVPGYNVQTDNYYRPQVIVRNSTSSSSNQKLDNGTSRINIKTSSGPLSPLVLSPIVLSPIVLSPIREKSPEHCGNVDIVTSIRNLQLDETRESQFSFKSDDSQDDSDGEEELVIDENKEDDSDSVICEEDGNSPNFRQISNSTTPKDTEKSKEYSRCSLDEDNLSTKIDEQDGDGLRAEVSGIDLSTEEDSGHLRTEADNMDESTEVDGARMGTEIDGINESTEVDDARMRTEEDDAQMGTEVDNMDESTEVDGARMRTEVDDIDESAEVDEVRLSTEGDGVQLETEGSVHLRIEDGVRLGSDLDDFDMCTKIDDPDENSEICGVYVTAYGKQSDPESACVGDDESDEYCLRYENVAIVESVDEDSESVICVDDDDEFNQVVNQTVYQDVQTNGEYSGYSIMNSNVSNENGALPDSESSPGCSFNEESQDHNRKNGRRISLDTTQLDESSLLLDTVRDEQSHSHSTENDNVSAENEGDKEMTICMNDEESRELKEPEDKEINNVNNIPEIENQPEETYPTYEESDPYPVANFDFNTDNVINDDNIFCIDLRDDEVNSPQADDSDFLEFIPFSDEPGPSTRPTTRSRTRSSARLRARPTTRSSTRSSTRSGTRSSTRLKTGHDTVREVIAEIESELESITKRSSDTEMEAEPNATDTRAEDKCQNDSEDIRESNKEAENSLPEAEQIETRIADLEKISEEVEESQNEKPKTNRRKPDPPVSAPPIKRARRRHWRAGGLRVRISDISNVLYECCVEDCPFATRLHYLFEAHIETNHPKGKWNGECDECEGQMEEDEPLTLIAALKHLELHVKQAKNSCSATLWESSDSDISDPEENNLELTKALEEFQKEIDSRNQPSCSKEVSTTNHPTDEAHQEENVSAEAGEEERTSDFGEEDSNGDNNLTFEVQDAQNENSEAQGFVTDCNELGSATTSQINESGTIFVQTPDQDCWGSPPVLTPVIPYEISTPVWSGFNSPPTLTPYVIYEPQTPVRNDFVSTYGFEYTQPCVAPTPVVENVITVLGPTATNPSSSQIPVGNGFSSPFNSDSSQSYKYQTPVGYSNNFVAIPTIAYLPIVQAPTTTDYNSSVVFHSSQPSESQTLPTENSESSQSCESQTPVEDGSTFSSNFESSQPSGSQTPVQKSTNVASLPTTANPSGSQTPARNTSDSPSIDKFSQPSESQTPVPESTNVASLPTTVNSSGSQTPTRNSSDSPFADRFSQPSGSQTPARDASDSVSIPSTSNALVFPTPPAEDSDSLSASEISQFSRSQTPVGDETAVFTLTASNPPGSQTSIKDGFSSTSAFGSSQSSQSQTPDSNSANFVSIPSTSKAPGFLTPPTEDSDSLFDVDSQTRTKDRIVDAYLPSSSNLVRDGLNSTVDFESSQPTGSQTPEFTSQSYMVFPSTSTQSPNANVLPGPSTSSLTVILDRTSNCQGEAPPERYHLQRKKMHNQGHEISANGIRPNAKSLQAIRNFPPPSNQEEVREFLRLVRHCRRFVKGFSELTNPLIALSKANHFTWNEAEQKSFDAIKRIFKAEPMLYFPNFNEDFVLTVERCEYGLSTVLSQGEIENGRVVAYASRKLTLREENFSDTEKELSAILWGVKHFKAYLQKQNFQIVSTHEPLTRLMTREDLGGRMAKLRQQLFKHQFKLIYCEKKRPSTTLGLTQSVKSSKANESFEKFIKFHYTAKDTPKIKTLVTSQTTHTPLVLFYSKDLSNYNPLSHYIRRHFNFHAVKEPNNLYDVVELKNSEQTIYLSICRYLHFEKLRYNEIFCSLKYLRIFLESKQYSGKIFVHDITKMYKHIKKDMFSEMIVYVFRNSNVEPVLLTINKMTPTVEQKRRILEKYHRLTRDEHFSFRITYARIKEKYKWKSMKNDVFNYVKHCRTCQDRDLDTFINNGYDSYDSTFHKLVVKILGPFPPSRNGNTYILIVFDLVTKYLYCAAIPTCNIRIISKKFWAFCKNFVVHGRPIVVFSDQGIEFTESVVRDGSIITERRPFPIRYENSLNSFLLYFKRHLNYNNNIWDILLTLMGFLINNRKPVGSTRFSPFQVVFRRTFFVYWECSHVCIAID